MTSRSKVIRGAAKVAQWRASGADKDALKSARRDADFQRIESLIRKYVSDAEFRKISRRGCVHVVDFPEKTNRALRGEGAA